MKKIKNEVYSRPGILFHLEPVQSPLGRPEIIDFFRFVVHVLHVRCATILKNQGFLADPGDFEQALKQ